MCIWSLFWSLCKSPLGIKVIYPIRNHLFSRAHICIFVMLASVAFGDAKRGYIPIFRLPQLLRLSGLHHLIQYKMKESSFWKTYVALWDPGFLKFKHDLEFCPIDCRKTIHWNVVLAIFQHDQIWQICHGCLKYAGPTFQCMVALQFREQRPDSCLN